MSCHTYTALLNFTQTHPQRYIAGLYQMYQAFTFAPHQNINSYEGETSNIVPLRMPEMVEIICGILRFLKNFSQILKAYFCGRFTRPLCDGIGHPANVATCARMTLCPIFFKIHY
jgi:hypothetical protein